MQQFREDVITFLRVYIDSPLLDSLLTTPKDVSHGDFSLPVFPLAKAAGKNPLEFAKELAQKAEPSGLIVKVEAAGPYLNIMLDQEKCISQILGEVVSQKDSYGSTKQISKNIVMDFSAPNIAKPFGIGHLRSTVLGNANSNILKFCGANVTGINYIGDWGTQFGKVIWAFQHWGSEEDLQKDPIAYLLDLYVRFHESPTDDMNNEAREIFAKLEQGNEEYLALWKRFRDLSLANFDKTYELMNVTFDEYRGEAYYNDKMSATLDLLREKNLLETSDGAQIINFETHGLDIPPIIILKSDGGSTYALRDLAAAQDRITSFSAEELLYEVGSEQQLHFKQVFTALKLMGFEWADSCRHLGHGLYRLPEGKMSTRKGRIVLMEDVLHESIKRVTDIICERNPDLAKKDSSGSVAQAVGIGAVLFYDMKHDRVKNIEFDWERVLDFQGETGPYVQYTYARIKAMLRKFEADISEPNEALLDQQDDRFIAVHISQFSQAIFQSAKQYKPHVLCRYLLDMAQLCNEYYGKHKVLGDDVNLSIARLYLLSQASQVMCTGLRLLGIQSVEEM